MEKYDTLQSQVRKIMEIDDKILKHAMDSFGITEDQVRKILQEMIDDGLLQKNDDPSVPMKFKLTTGGCKFAEKTIIDDYGEFKKVVNHKGIAYKVPTIVIMREGIKEEELNQFPFWSDEK